MTPDEQVAAVKAALAEAGCPDAYVWFGHDPIARKGCIQMTTAGGVTAELAWRSLAVTGVMPDLACWPCWSATFNTVAACPHDYRLEPWPEVVR